MRTHPLGIVVTLLTLLITSRPSTAAPPKPATDNPKSLPPTTKPLAPTDKAQLESAVTALTNEVAALQNDLRDKPQLLTLLPDVQIYLNALRYPLVYHEQIDVKKMKGALEAGLERARQLRDGKSPWVTAGGPRGYLSKIDGSIQPYILAVPKSYKPGDTQKFPVDFFCHGRGEDMLELKFIGGKITPAENKFIVHPYGRYCCANKFAGEIDSLEILESLRKQYPVDENRIVMTGFSMGGAAVWHLAVHYADLWCAASPGAGFCETKIYQNLEAKGELATTPWYEQVLWHWYDAPDYVLNLFDIPLIAYAGTEDPQQQSGTIMEKAAKDAGVKIERIWGQGVGHKYEPKAKAELDKRLDAYAAKGRDPEPKQIKFETWTLRYNHMFWMTIDSLGQHWRRAKVEAQMKGSNIVLKTENITSLSIELPLRSASSLAIVEIDGTKIAVSTASKVLTIPPVNLKYRFVKTGSGWQEWNQVGEDLELRKRHGLQGPIDDAFLDRFIMVRPTGQPLNDTVGKWVNDECDHAIRQWHNIFRGEAIVKTDAEITDADIANSNLVLWGDPSSNRILARIATKLPIGWDLKQVTVGSHTFDAATHAPILIYPNPLNPKKYVVINSGFTFREDTNGTNSRQVPKLPDYVVVDLSTPPNARGPGHIVLAGFFGEKWELREDDGKIDP